MKRSPLWFILLPFTIIYGLIILIRNGLFSYGILKQKSYGPCILVVGNLSIGGTGKTPHIIALAKLLETNYSVAILSRGYKRKSKGFKWVLENDHPEISGDEPLEIKSRLGDLPVAVCRNRREGIETIIKELKSTPDIILLDDGFQHRFVKPDYSIILSRQESLYTKDSLLPSGRLREPIRGIKRAHVVCITNCKPELDLKALKKELKLSDNQTLISSSIKYSFLETEAINKESHILLITSIAHPESLLSILKTRFKQVSHLRFPDHHSYDQKDIKKIISTFNSLSDSQKMIITSGKDIVKLNQFEQFLTLPYCCARIDIVFNNSSDQILLKEIELYVK